MLFRSQLGGFDARGHVGQVEADALEVGNGLPELLALTVAELRALGLTMAERA
mgnify:CR=1 FL=1